MMIPMYWAHVRHDPTTIQRFIESGLVLSVSYNGVVYTGRVAHATKPIQTLVLPLYARSFWTAALAMNALYEKAWENHVRLSVESV